MKNKQGFLDSVISKGNFGVEIILYMVDITVHCCASTKYNLSVFREAPNFDEVILKIIEYKKGTPKDIQTIQNALLRSNEAYVDANWSVFSNHVTIDLSFAKGLQQYDIIGPRCFKTNSQIGTSYISIFDYNDLESLVFEQKCLILVVQLALRLC